MGNLLLTIGKMLLILLAAVIGFIQDVGGLFVVCTINDRNHPSLFTIIIFSYIFSFLFPMWCISYVNNNKKWAELENLEKGFAYISGIATIIFYATVFVAVYTGIIK